MTEFRPTVAPLAAPKPTPLRRWAAFGAVAALAALSVPLLFRGEPPRPVDTATPAAPERSAWDAAIASFGATSAPTRSSSADDMPGRLSLAALELRPQVVNGVAAGYLIGPGELPRALAEAGLQAGDVLTMIDGLPLDDDRARRLADEFGGLDDIEVTYQRGGELRDTLIVFRDR